MVSVDVKPNVSFLPSGLQVQAPPLSRPAGSGSAPFPACKFRLRPFPGLQDQAPPFPGLQDQAPPFPGLQQASLRIGADEDG